jgi:drug/metabolite transporter (DMT)-like permease
MRPLVPVADGMGTRPSLSEVRAPLLPVVVLLASSTLWGLTWLPLKRFGDFGIEGPLVTLGAHGTVGVLVLPALLLLRKAWIGQWRSMLLLGVFGGLANLAFSTAMQLGDVTRVMALFYLLPAWGVVLARVLLGERVDRKRGLSLACALVGAFLVLGGVRLLVAPPTWIDGLAVLSGFSLAVNNVVFRKAQDVPMTPKVMVVFAGSLVWAFGAVVFGASAAEVTTEPIRWLEVVAFGLIWILAATAGTLYGVNHLEAGRSSVLIIMELVTAVASSVLVLGTLPDASACAGGVLILAAALLEALRRSP